MSALRPRKPLTEAEAWKFVECPSWEQLPHLDSGSCLQELMLWDLLAEQFTQYLNLTIVRQTSFWNDLSLTWHEQEEGCGRLHNFLEKEPIYFCFAALPMKVSVETLESLN